MIETNSVILKTSLKNTSARLNGLIALVVAICSANSLALPTEASFLKPKAKQGLAENKNETQQTNDSQPKASDEPETVLDNSNAKTMPYADESVKHYNKGVELHQAGFLNQAIGEYKEAISADNRMEEAYSNLGIIYAAQHNYPKAREAFEEALRLRPKSPTTLNGLGTVIYAQGQTDEAMKKWQEALSADPKFASAYYNMGNAYEGQKNFEQAKACYLKAIEVMPNMADAYFRLGNILSKESHLPQAELLLSKSVELSPDGEFVREAKHSLAIIESRFEKTKAKNSAIHKKS